MSFASSTVRFWSMAMSMSHVWRKGDVELAAFLA